MKTKLLIILLLSAMTCLNAYGQYYQTQTTYQIGDVVYKCDIDDGHFVSLYNSRNQRTYEIPYQRNGEPMSHEMAMGEVRTMAMTRETDPDIQQRVNSAFTAAQKSSLKAKDATFGVQVVIDTQTGLVSEVNFTFYQKSPLKDIPPAVFRQIEQNFTTRPQITGLTVTDAGREMTWTSISWNHRFP